MTESNRQTERFRRGKAAIVATSALLLAKVLASIVLEYRHYFPPNFDAAFLIGREATFTRGYAAAFYVHIVVGPLVVLLAALLLGMGSRPAWRKLHRWAGRVLMILVLLGIVPTGLVMATRAFAGPVAGFGFAALALATGWSAAATTIFAWRRNFGLHRLWANRCLVLLISPLILRLASGAMLVLGMESPVGYQLNAWLSWLAPLIVFEIARQASRRIARFPQNVVAGEAAG